MKQKKVIILGAGPAGLGTAMELMKSKDHIVTLIEMGSSVGGLARTVDFNGYLFDLGPHRFFSKIKEINALWQDVLKEDFLTKSRYTRIYYKNKFYAYPLKIKHTLFNLGITESVLIGLSFLKSKFFPYKQENTFEEWVSNRFGKRLFNTFF